MCEDRIEAAFDQKGIVAADYDLEKKTIHVVYKTKKWDEERLHKLATACWSRHGQVQGGRRGVRQHPRVLQVP